MAAGTPYRASGERDAALREALGARLDPAEPAREVARSVGMPRHQAYGRSLVLRGER